MTAEPTILVIDDDVNTVRGFSTLLKYEGYKVHTAYCASDGLELARSHQLDAITLDFQMPLINGAGFLYRLRQMPAHQRTPVLLVTGMSISAELDAELADLRAMVKFKPLDPSEFLVEIAQLVEAGRLPQTEMGHQNAPGVAQFVA
jgi:CheY-like chemotaxis protein